MLNKLEIGVAKSIQPCSGKSLLLWWVNFSGCSGLGNDDLFCHVGVAWLAIPKRDRNLHTSDLMVATYSEGHTGTVHVYKSKHLFDYNLLLLRAKLI